MTNDEATDKIKGVTGGSGYEQVWNYDSVTLDGDYSRDELRQILDILCEVDVRPEVTK